ncbi:MAG TPA: hypothetical protein VIJ87_13120 [Pyrinomonadaceae bacterium]
MAEARYEIYVPYPSVVSSAAMAYAKTELPKAVISTENGRQVYTDMGQENFSVVHVIAEDQPFTDSTVKQIAAFVADHMQENIMVSKAGKSGLNVWTIPSPS